MAAYRVEPPVAPMRDHCLFRDSAIFTYYRTHSILVIMLTIVAKSESLKMSRGGEKGKRHLSEMHSLLRNIGNHKMYLPDRGRRKYVYVGNIIDFVMSIFLLFLFILFFLSFKFCSIYFNWNFK